ncbi:response regulator [Motilimonas cestriensis]|uniref:Response regulator n=1 Tax=Motilimonas cestriensis TaxID=2742685 RepID=A0ABS8WBY1_9GAMM|nr:response regulator [Motilimonas cestriensis]MCE2596005.1 response regulator [Motilimonas cestriensis]
MKILIVDDSKAMQAIVKRSLKACGYGGCDTQLASDGAEALTIIKQWQPDIVLSDWYMPKMTGLELLQAVKEQGIKVKIGFVTSETAKVKLKQALAAGAEFVLSKPFEDEALHQAMLPLLDENDDGDTEVVKASASACLSQEIQDRILLPRVNAIDTVFNAFSVKELLLEAVPGSAFHGRWLPCFLAMFVDGAKKVRAVAVIDFAGLVILGAGMDGLEDAQTHEIIKKKSVPKAMMANVNQVFKVLGASMVEQKTGCCLTLQSVNFAAKSMPKLEKMFNKPNSERVDVELAVLGYGQGYLTLVCS